MAAMYRSSRACPHCFGVLVLFRSRPSPFPRILGFQLWRCPECGITFEAANTITRESSTADSKGWIYRIEATKESNLAAKLRMRELRRRRRNEQTKAKPSDSHSESDGESNSDAGKRQAKNK